MENLCHVVCINVSYVIEFLAWGVLISKVFTHKSTIVKWNCCILWIDIAYGLQKLGLILESKVVQKLSLEKNGFNKKPKLISLDENSFMVWATTELFTQNFLNFALQSSAIPAHPRQRDNTWHLWMFNSRW